MDYLFCLLERAGTMRERIAGLLENFSDFPPELRKLQEELSRIEDCLKALRGELQKKPFGS